MIKNFVTTGADIIDIGKRYGDYLCNVGLNQLVTYNYFTGQSLNNNFLQWKNPESVDSGTSGIVLFLLELYRKTEEQQYLDAVNNAVNELIAYCKNNSTNNYSFYTGRGGVIYTLMQVYKTTGDYNLIQECQEMIKPANKEFLQSKYISDYLYDGRAGTLLIILQLYLICKDDSLLEYIDSFTNKIITNARLTQNGICWCGEEGLNLRPSCGFAHGAAGIRYVLSQLRTYFGNTSLTLLIDETDKYIDSCWVEEFGNWGDFRADILNAADLKKYKESYTHDLVLFIPQDDCSWANGTAGVLFASDDKGAYSEAAMDKLIAAIANNEIAACGLYDGLPGLGMFLLTGANRVSDYLLEKIKNKIAYGRLATAEINLQGGLMHSRLGGVYFLLKSLGNETLSENVLFPFIYDYDTQYEPVVDLSIDAAHVRRELLSKNYPRLVYLLQKAAADGFNEFLERSEDDPKDEMQRFSSFMENESASIVSPSLHERLMDLYYFENEKFKFYYSQTRSPLQVYLDDLYSQDTNLEYLNRPDAWLLKQTLTVSDKIRIVYTRWDWSFVDDFKQMQNKGTLEKLVTNLTAPSQKHEYIFQPAGRLEFTEVSLVMALKLVVHRFDSLRTVGQALTEIRYYLQSLSEKGLDDFLIAVGAARSSNPAEFLQRLDKMVLDQVRPLVGRNILVFNSPTFV